MRADLMTAFAPRSAGPLGTAMRSLGHFAKATPNRELFLPLRFRGDLEREAWNEWTILLWVRFLARTKSTKTKRYLKVGSIETRISLGRQGLPEPQVRIRDRRRGASTPLLL